MGNCLSLFFISSLQIQCQQLLQNLLIRQIEILWNDSHHYFIFSDFIILCHLSMRGDGVRLWVK